MGLCATVFPTVTAFPDGRLGGLQTASIIAAAPFLLVMVGLCASLWIGLLDDIEVHGHFGELDAKASPAEAGN